MSANELDDLDALTSAYVDAFRRVEQPSVEAAARSWAAIEAQIVHGAEARSRRWPVIAIVGLAAAAAVVLLSMRWGEPVELSRAPATNASPHVTPPSSSSEVTLRPRAAPAVLPAAAAGNENVSPAESTAQTPAEHRGEEPAARRRAVRPKRAAHVPDNSLAEETRLWRVAQSEYASGNTDAAQRAIVIWASRFPDGRFADERELLHARVLCSAGREKAARNIRDTFVARSPSAPLAPRMRAVCGRSETP